MEELGVGELAGAGAFQDAEVRTYETGTSSHQCFFRKLNFHFRELFDWSIVRIGRIGR